MRIVMIILYRNTIIQRRTRTNSVEQEIIIRGHHLRLCMHVAQEICLTIMKWEKRKGLYEYRKEKKMNLFCDQIIMQSPHKYRHIFLIFQLIRALSFFLASDSFLSVFVP